MVERSFFTPEERRLQRAYSGAERTVLDEALMQFGPVLEVHTYCLCGERVEPARARLGAVTCHDCAPPSNAYAA